METKTGTPKIVVARKALKDIQDEALDVSGDYEARLSYREQLVGLKEQARQAILSVEQAIIEKMDEQGIKNNESESFIFEWHNKAKTVWDKERLSELVEHYSIKPRTLIGLLYKNFALSVKGLKSMGEAGEDIIQSCRTVEVEEDKTLAVRIKKGE